MCHSRSGTPSAFATSTASMVLPVPGSPLTRSGRCSVIAALTASVRSSVETYASEPLNRIGIPVASTALIVYNRSVRLLFLLFLVPAAAVRAATVAVDVGHFLEEPGATSARGRPEFEFNSDLAVEIESAARGAGLHTVLIGYDGFMSQLTHRTAAAAGTDFFLAVHHDSVQPYLIRTWEDENVERRFNDDHAGFSLFVSRKNPALKRSLACASAIGEALRGAGFAPSLYHADPIPGENKPFADKVNGVHYY